MKLDGRVAIVTGAAGDIGRAISLRLAGEGVNVVLADINIERANRVASEVKALGRMSIVVGVDVSKSREANSMARTCLNYFGQIDILVNNAGGTARGKASLFYESTEGVWDAVLGVNLKGVLNCFRAVITHMMERRKGKIVNLGSTAGVVGDAGLADYSAAKGGVIAFTKALAKEVGSYGINVNCVSPGPIDTQGLALLPQIREKAKNATILGRLGKPEEVANIVAFLVSDEADYIVGQNLLLCGGRSLGF
jgi:2-hydroxycyclohexanecarboxyl-CoA dehydrogenase